jgi:hypothetical protein
MDARFVIKTAPDGIFLQTIPQSCFMTQGSEADPEC